MTGISQIKLLISLSQVDGVVAGPEKSFILSMGKAYGISEETLETLLSQRHIPVVPENLSHQEKFECILSLVQLMKVDERVYKEELLFCSKIATVLGYEKQVIAELMVHAKASDMTAEEISSLRVLTDKYL